MSNHLGNVLTVINDIKVPQATNSVDVDVYLATIVSTADFSSFGVQLDGRTVSAESYRYGFNGLERDDELKGKGNSYDFGARIYDCRVGRWLTIDPLEAKFPNVSPYTFVNNMPVWAIDPDGKDIIVLSAPSGAKGMGHAAVLIGNDKDGWFYYSKDGTQDHGFSGPSYNPKDGIKFASIQDFANSQYNFVDGEQYYTSAFKITSNKETDDKMKAAASETVNSDYHLFYSSCIDVATNALNAGGFNGVNASEPDFVSTLDIPNIRYKMMKAVNKKYGVENVSIKPSAEVIQLEKEANQPDFTYKIIDHGAKYHSNNSDKTRVYNPEVVIAEDNREAKKIAKEKLNEIRKTNENK